MKNIYLQSGYLNIPALLSTKMYFVIVVGGRGIGKTYGGLDYGYTKYPGEFIYMRRTPKIVKILSVPVYQVWTKLDIDKNYKIITKKISEDTSGFYESDEEGKPIGEPIGLMLSLETFSDVRSAGLDQIKYIFYDEFIPEPHRKKIKEEGRVLLNILETVNRNRELVKQEPIKVLMVSNSENIFAPVLSELKLTDYLVKMQKKNISIQEIPERHILLLNCHNNPISALKRSTAIYEFAGEDSKFAKVALNNTFVNIPDCIKSVDIKPYNLLYKLHNLFIYQHKFSSQYYVTTFKKGEPLEKYSDSDRDLTSFKRHHIEMISAFYNDDILFEKTSIYSEFTNLLTLSQ